MYLSVVLYSLVIYNLDYLQYKLWEWVWNGWVQGCPDQCVEDWIDQVENNMLFAAPPTATLWYPCYCVIYIEVNSFSLNIWFTYYLNDRSFIWHHVNSSCTKGINIRIPLAFDPLSSQHHFCGQVNQSVRYVHNCLESAILIKTSTSNHSHKSVVLESTAKLSLGYQFGFDRRFKNHWLRMEELN